MGHRVGQLYVGAGQGAVAARGLAGHRSDDGEELHCESLALYILLLLLSLLFPLLFCPIKLSSSQPTIFYLFFPSQFSPPSQWEAGGEPTAARC